MSWNNRLRPVITFTSPSGLTFSPLWKGDDIKVEKRLGRHAYPNIDKEVIQDLGMNSREIPLTVYFDGADNDKNSRMFENALLENGEWQIIHPVDGLLKLQLISYSRQIQPVDNGNITVLKTEWIEPLEENTFLSIPETTSEIANATELLKDLTINETKSISINFFRNGLMKIVKTISNINPRIDTVLNIINDLFNNNNIDITAISDAVIEILDIFVSTKNQFLTKINILTNLSDRLISLFPTSFSVQINEFLKSAYSGQMILNLILYNTGNTIISTNIQTRREALTVLKKYWQFTRHIQETLEKVSLLTKDNKIEEQFSVRIKSGEVILTLNAAISRYLLSTLFDLKIEKIIILNKPRSPIEIVINEMGANASNVDELLSNFCTWNSLHGHELLLLKAGREVVIYE